MKNHEQNWSLFRLSDRKQFDDVKLETIDFFFRALSEKARPDWLMWREGFSGWRPFNELPQILKHLQKDAKPAPPPVPDSVLQYADEITGVRHHVESPKTEEPTPARGMGDSSVVVFESPHEEPVAEEQHASVQEVDSSDDEMMEDDLTPTADIPAHVMEASQSQASNDSSDDMFSKSHSSVSVRAIQAATSSLRLKTNTSALPPREIVREVPKEPSLVKDTSNRTPKPAERMPEEHMFTQDDAATLSLMLESQAAVEDRNNVRYQKRFKVRIYTSQGVVTAVTTDCSTSGFRFKDPLPPGLPRFFHLEIDLGADGKIPLVCSEIKEKDGRPGTRVRIQVNDHANTLKSALVRAA